jgi:4'-phosphopantetheinyl transferase
MKWQSPQIFPTLQTNQVHVWRADLKRDSEELAKFSKSLSTQEKLRASKFVAEKSKNNFIAARGILRHLLAKYLQAQPQDLIFQQNQHGKLYINSSPLQFNISHSRDLALFIFSRHNPVGVDVEYIRENFEFTNIAKRFFSKKELSDLLALPTDQQLSAFFNCWSRKEAFIKAIGKGIFQPLDEFSVEISNRKEGRLDLEFTDTKFDTGNWKLEALDPEGGYAGAFAVSSLEHATHLYNFL